MGKTITITAHWRSAHTVEVPDDFQINDELNSWPDEVLEQITSETADLVDWD